MSDASLADMGIGGHEPDQELSRPDQHIDPQRRDELMFAELGAILGDTPDDQQQSTQQAQPQQVQSQQSAQQSPDQSSDTQEPEYEDGLPFSLPPVEGGGRGGVGTGDSATTPTAEQQAQQAADAQHEFDVKALFDAAYGRPITEDEARALIAVTKDLEQLSPGQQAAFQQILNGGAYQPQYPQAPAPQAPPQGYQPQYPQQPYQQPTMPTAVPPQQQWTPQYPQQPQPQQQPGQPQVPQWQLPPDIDPEFAQALAPAAQVVDWQTQQLQATQQQLAAMQAQMAEQNQQRIRDENMRLGAQVDAEAARWRDEKVQSQRLTPEEFLNLEQDALRSNLLPAMIQQAGGDPVAGTRNLMEHIYWQSPVLRQREAQLMADAERKRAAAQQQRTNASTALSGGGGSRPAAPVGTKTTRNNGTRRDLGDVNNNAGDGLIDGIAEAMGLNG